MDKITIYCDGACRGNNLPIEQRIGAYAYKLIYNNHVKFGGSAEKATTNNIMEMVKKAREHRMKPVLLTLPPINSRLYFNFISKGKSPENILSWLGDNGHIYRYHERYSTIVTKIARECHCRLIDIRSAFLDIWDTKDFFCADGIHPSQKGQEFIGNTI